MPPRFTFWTIILDGQPTAFRAAEREELLPTLKQLQAKNPAAVLKWFARGRVWESPEEARRVRTEAETSAREAFLKERRAREWRPGGEHRDPRDKFKKETFQARKRREKKAANLAHAPRPDEGAGQGGVRPKGPGQGAPRSDRPRPGGWNREGGRPPRRDSGGATGGFRPKGPGQGAPRSDCPRPGGWNREGGRPPRRDSGGATGGFRPQGRGPDGPGRSRPRNKPWGGGDRERRPDRPPREERRPAPQTPPQEQAPKPVAPVERVAPPVVQPAAPERIVPPFEPGPPAPAHKTRMPRLRKP